VFHGHHLLFVPVDFWHGCNGGCSMPKYAVPKYTVVVSGILALTLAGCGGTSVPVPNPTPVTNGPLSIINVLSGQTVSNIMANSPGASVKLPTEQVDSVKVEIFRPNGLRWWQRTEEGTFACITGVKDSSCNSWTTQNVPDGNYRLKATAALSDGTTLTAELSFLVKNQSSTPQTPPPGSPPPPPSPPSGPVNRVAWNEVRHWMRQDVGCDLNSVINTRFDMVTLSPKCIGRLLERGDLDRIKASGKWVLAYEDIAVAAPWDTRVWPTIVNASSPAILFQTQWGSYLADVTSDAWFRAVETVIRDDLARGYDGIWLDDCAAFWLQGGPTVERVNNYSNIVKRVRALVDSIRPGVKLMCNTDSELIKADVERSTGFLGALDGITIEGFSFHCFGPGDCRPNNEGRRADEERWGGEAFKRGEKVFVLDYAYSSGDQRYAWNEARKRGWVPAVNQGPTVGAFLD
jgi:endo-alpha-1,4-polygalactosaminidase (GH114 family)